MLRKEERLDDDVVLLAELDGSGLGGWLVGYLSEMELRGLALLEGPMP